MKNYQDVLSLILQDVSEDSDKIPAADADMLHASSKECGECGPEYDRRDTLYSDLLENYIKTYDGKAKCNKIYKFLFFTVSMLIFIGVVGAAIASLIIIALKKESSIADVAVLISGAAEIISVVIVLPKIIAEHLFPTNEDDNMIGMVKNMQVNDSKIRAFSKGKRK